MNTQLLIPAAGAGTRLGCTGPKALVDLAGRPMIVRTLARFEPLGLLDGAVIVVAAAHREAMTACLAAAWPDRRFCLVEGGAERQESVMRGLDALDSGTGIVVIHDAARPFVAAASVTASVRAAEDTGAATVAVPAADTILEVEDGTLVNTPERARLWACQTPQTFRVDVIREAHRAARTRGFAATDDATVVRRAGGRVRIVEGTALNFKVTTPDDLALARLVAQEDLA